MTERIRTGCTLLDLVVGGGEGLGFPAGKVVNLVGDKSSGKTFLACEMVASAHHEHGKKLRYNFDDGESGFTFDTKKLYGFEAKPEDALLSRKIEDFDTNTRKFLNGMKDGQIGIYVLDSLDGLGNTELEERDAARFKASEEGKEFKDGTYGMKTPKFLSQEFFRNKTADFSDTKTLLVIVSQVRENINRGLYGPKHVRAGGKALDFYAHTCLWLATKKKIEKNGRVIGVIVEAWTEKSKTPRPFRECIFPVYFDYGIDNIGACLDFLFDLRTKEKGDLKEGAKTISWDGKEPTLENVVEFLDKHKLLDKAREEKEKETGKKALKLEWIDPWIKKNPDLSKSYDKDFPPPISRDDLIQKIEADPKLKAELERRTIEKWETIEKSASSNRKRKYE